MKKSDLEKDVALVIEKISETEIDRPFQTLDVVAQEIDVDYFLAHKQSVKKLFCVAFVR